MVYIEDLIEMLVLNGISMNKWDMQVVNGFREAIHHDVGFTIKQSELALRIIDRYKTKFNNYSDQDIANYLKNPQFRLPIRKSVKNRSVKISENSNKKFIDVEFPYDDELVNKIRQHRVSSKMNSDIHWDKDKLCWCFSLNEQNIKFVLETFTEGNFEFDIEFQNYADQYDEIVNNLENYIPELILDNKIPKIRNSLPGMPEITETEILPAVFQSRKFGVIHWSEDIDKYISSDAVDPMTATFLRTFEPINLEKTEEKCLENIIKYLSPCLFVIPGGSEFSKIQEIYNLVHTNKIDIKNVSVLFRLPNETNKNFNDFVKNQGINGPITDDTKIVCISGKLPKTVLKSKIEFNSIINFGYENAHYSLKEFIKNHENLVFLRPGKSLK